MPGWGHGLQGPVLGLVLGHDGLALAHLLAQLRHLRPQGCVLLLQEGRPDGDLVLLQAPGVPRPLGRHVVLLASRPVLFVLSGRVLCGSLLFPMREPNLPLLPALHTPDSSYNPRGPARMRAGTPGKELHVPRDTEGPRPFPGRRDENASLWWDLWWKEGRSTYWWPALCCSNIKHCLYSCLT